MRFRLILIFSILFAFVKAQQTGSFNSNPSCATWTVIKPSCSPGCDAKIILTIAQPSCFAGGPYTLPYSIAIAPSGTCPLPTGSGTYNPGTYTISTDACACLGLYFISITDNSATLFDFANVPVNQPSIQRTPGTLGTVTCAPPVACNGSVSQIYFNATAPYNFTVTPPSGAPINTVSNGPLTNTGLCAGIMTVNVLDAQGCTATFTNNIPGPAAFNWGSSTQSVTCFGFCDGAAVVSPTGGTSGYTINWSTGATSVIAAGQTASITGLCANAIISASVTDANGCVYPPFTTTITGPPQLTVTSNATMVSCPGGTNGAISLTVSGGIAPYNFTWTPGPGANSPSITGLGVGGQTVTISNNGGLCTTTLGFNITGPNAWTINPVVTHVQCNGLANGSASLGVDPASGNGGPFQYTWSPVPGGGQGTGTVTGLTAQNYTAVIADITGCTTLAIISVTAPPAYTVAVTTQSLLCFNVCTGGASVTVSGGTGPYSFTWNPNPPAGQGTGTISNSCANSYTVNILDAQGCPTSTTVVITQPSSITPNVSSSSITCAGACNGVITASPSGGNSPYTYTLLLPGGGTTTAGPSLTASLTGLCVGIHTLIIGGTTGCTQSFTFNIQEPNPLIANIVSTSVTCFNGCNGTVAGNVIGGSPGYSFLWTTPTGTASGPALAGQCAGNYTLIVTDANSCTATATATLAEPTQITVTITPTNPSCNGNCNGILNANVGGGTPGYTLSWSNGFIGNPNINLCAGNYTLTVNDANNCTVAVTQSLTNPPNITITVNTSSPSCAGGCNGSATITPSGGTPGYTIQCNVPPLVSNTTGIISGLCTGNYIATVIDANNCSQPVVFSINNPPALSIVVNSVQTSCNACTGGATITPSGGTPTYAIVWTNTLGATVGTTSAMTGLCPGNYTVTVTDVAGCIATANILILQTVNVSIAIAGSGILCFNACTGTAVATPTGGSAPYNFTWTPSGQNTQTATGLCAGVHTVLVTDQFLCSNTATINFVNPPDIIVATSQTNIPCAGFCNGAISATASGGTGVLTYSWLPGGQSTSSITNLCVGGYTLIVFDANNCSKQFTFDIVSNPSITATFTATSPTGCGVSNGSICVTASGGNGGPYTYTWTPGVSNASCATGLGAGAYSVIISDGVCTNTIATALSNPAGPSLTPVSTSVSCFGGNNGGATVTASGGGPYTFTWSPATASAVVGATTTAGSLNSGTYNISVQDMITNCITSQTINILGPPALTVTSSFTNPLCNTSNNGTIVINTSGGTPGYNFAWTPTTGIVGQGTQTVSSLSPAIYTVTITDANSCVQTRTFNVVAPPAITLTATFTNVLCFNACNGSALANGSGGTAPITYSWLPVGGFAGAITASINGLCPNIYTVIATDGNGCSATTTVSVTEPPQLTATLTSIGASCSNSCNASATVAAIGGTPVLTYSWTGSPVTTPTINGLCAGNYSATVSDGNGCFTVMPFVIATVTPFTATLVPTNPLCNSSCNGSITTNLAGNQGTVSFNWAPAGTGQNPTGLCAGNYTLIATDAASCQANAVVTLTNPPAVLANITTTNPSCNGNCNGAAISNATNVTAPVSFTWLPGGQNTPSISSQCAGNFTLTIVDNNSCTVTQTFALVNPPAYTIVPSAAPASCGLNNGSITVVVSGGTPTYNIAWQPGGIPNGSVATGLGAGIYTVNITDINNCTNSLTIPLSNANGPSVTPVSSTSITCNGACTGGATVNLVLISGGTGPYTANWLVPPAPSSVNPINGLCAGTYTAQITDSSLPSACTMFTTVTIAEPPPLIINPSFTLPTCNGICNGTIVLNTSGATPGYTYNWSPLGPNNSPTLTSACAGDYTIQITDANGCLSTETVNLPATLNMTALFNTSQNPCFGNCVGSITITPSGGAPVMNTSWSNGQFGNVASNLCNGTYTALVTDGNGCFNTFTQTINSPTQITATSSIAAPGCSLCNGSATITPSGGTGAPYQFNWTNSATTSVVNNLCAGLYQVLITDANSCTVTQNVLISSNSGITGETFTTQNVSCFGLCNGGATVSPIGGAPVITFSWIAPSSTLSSINNLCPGDYFVQMTDANGCVRTASTSISAVNVLTVNPFVFPPTCGNNDGSISIVPSGGTPGYTINWLPPIVSSGTTVTNLGAGVYGVSITDAAGCTYTQTFTFSNLTAPALTHTQTNVNCFGACTGSIIAEATGTSTPFTYTWSTGANGPVVTSLCSGLVTLTVIASDGCRAFQTFTITENQKLQLSITNTVQPMCADDCNGQITLIPSGGTLPYTFLWSPSSMTTNPATSLCAGPGSLTVYTGTVTDALGCTINETVTLVNPATLTAVSSLTNSSCSSIADGSATVLPAGGTPTFNINWSGPNSFTANTQSINNVLAGDYTVTVVDSKSCTQTSTLTIVPTISITADAGRDTSFCDLGSIILTGTNSSGAVQYEWLQMPIPSPTIAATSSVLVNPPTGTHTFVLITTSSVLACKDTDFVVVNSLALPFVDAGPSFTIPIFSNITIGGAPTSTGAATFTWLPAGTLDNPFIANPIASNTVDVTYTVIVVDPATGCTASDTVRVVLYPQIIIPNGFSPNGDTKNDKWVIDNIQQFPENTVEVYNRWGELLFYRKNYQSDFDGRFNGKDLPVGTYYYVINLNHPAYTKPYTGPLTIFR
ncbi:MAG: gliding motility-associated C-terminal domain-containing protein [Sphingobacteriaceae bacterium]|nr:gliding motility-associated C-terminal domain-containing protein [Sphingobacteriaceae bacterium]